MKKRLLFLFLAGTLFLLAGCGLMPEEEELPIAPILKEGEELEYKVTTVERGDVKLTERIRATYIPATSAQLSFKIGDESIGQIYVNLGDSVKAGDILMELDVTQIEAQIRQQQNQLDSLNLQLRQLQESREMAISQARVEDAKAAEDEVIGWVSRETEVIDSYASQIRQANNSIQVTTQRISELERLKTDRQIISPIDGSVTFLYEFELGERSAEGRTVISIVDMSEAFFEVYSNNGIYLESGQQYVLQCDGEEYDVIAKEGSELDYDNADDGKMYLLMMLPDLGLTQGTNGVVEVVMEQSLNTLYVTNEAIREMEDGQTVLFVLDEEGMRTNRIVKTGVVTPRVTEIVEGVEQGDVVIIN